MRGDLRADHFLQLGALVGPVQAGGDEDEDVLAGDALLFEGPQHRRQDEAVGHRPGDVADEDAGVLAAAGELGERRRADGIGAGPAAMACSGSASGGAGRMASGPTTRSSGRFTLQAGAAVIEGDAHGVSLFG